MTDKCGVVAGNNGGTSAHANDAVSAHDASRSRGPSLSLSLSSLELRARSKLNDRASPQLVQILFTIPPPPLLRDTLSIRTDIPTDFAISFSTLRLVGI